MYFVVISWLIYLHGICWLWNDFRANTTYDFKIGFFPTYYIHCGCFCPVGGLI